jgi:urea transport system ATP-binding protein
MSNTDYALAIEDLTVSFDGFKAIDTLTRKFHPPP